MRRGTELFGMLGIALGLAACNGGGAAALDPTGPSGMAAAASSGATVGRTNPGMGRIAPRLRDVAAGDVSRPDPMKMTDEQAARMAPLLGASLVSGTAGALVGGAMSGGVGLAATAPMIAMDVATAGVTIAQVEGARAQNRALSARMQAQKAVSRIIPDADRPAEARALLAILEGSGEGSATWTNPETGASGRVTVKAQGRQSGADGSVCQMVAHDWRGGGQARSGQMLVCRSGGEWYDLS